MPIRKREITTAGFRDRKAIVVFMAESF